MYEILILILIAVDQLSKIKLKEFLESGGSFPVIDNFFYLTYVENRGAAFGLFQGRQIFFVVIALAVTAGGLYIIHRKCSRRITKTAISMVIAGAVGNLIDRLRLGYVIDFFDFRFIWNYVFNFADILVVVGTVILFMILIFDTGNDENKENQG